MSRTSNGGRVRLSAERAGDRLRLEIADNGPGPTKNGDGIGLANTRARLAGLYGSAGRLELKGTDLAIYSSGSDLPLRFTRQTPAAESH